MLCDAIRRFLPDKIFPPRKCKSQAMQRAITERGKFETRYKRMRRADPDTQLVADLWWDWTGTWSFNVLHLDALTGSPDSSLTGTL